MHMILPLLKKHQTTAVNLGIKTSCNKYRTTMKIWFLTLSFLLSNLLLKAQMPEEISDTSRMQISLLTCTPGEELYSTFGHSALRVIDSNSVTDLVYNYGTFDFNDPNFYTKFVRGQLNYNLSLEYFSNFKFDYQAENRGITEQILNLSAAEKLKLRLALNENLKEENRYYLYDFFLDNCTTRLRDLIFKASEPQEALPATMPVTYTFRNAIHFYLDQQEKYWSKLGIDLLLGKPTDAVMTIKQQQFLPDNLEKTLDKLVKPKLVKSSTNLYIVNSAKEKSSWFTPITCFWALLILFVLLSISKNKTLRNITSFLDAALFLICGLLGILFLFMWWGTDHSMTKENFNLLWALPTHAIFAWLKNRSNKTVKFYFLFTSLLSLLTLAFWVILPQQLNISLIPIVLLLMYRSFYQFIKK